MAKKLVASKGYGKDHDLGLHSSVYSTLSVGDTIEVHTFSVDEATALYRALTPAQRAVTFFTWTGLAPGTSVLLPRLGPV